MQQNTIADTITAVTYKEVMIFWKINKRQACHRLTVIRKILGKQSIHRLTVDQYCKGEDITLSEFNSAMQNYYSSFKK